MVIADFCRHYGLEFRRPDLVKLALTHRSYLTVSGQGPRESNERLEFLGDSVLGLVTSEFLYQTHPNEHEGQLTKTKSLLVSKAILSRRALGMGLGRFVLMSHSEIESGGRQRLSILADAFEAVVGAIYLDQGFEAARAFIARWLLRDTGEIVADKRHTNFKSHLQEYVQSTYRTHPIYRIRSEMGPDHSKQFNVEVLVGKRVLGSGKGRNKKEAEQAAARNALEQVETAIARRSGQEPAERVEPRVERTRAPEARPERARAAEPRPERARAPEPAAAAVEEPASNMPGTDVDRARRRGRRGGRGRTRREDASGAASSAVAETNPTIAPTAAPGSARRTHAPAPRPAPPSEAVPIRERPTREALEETPRFDDDFEEVGRPEGPPGEPAFERHLDRFEAIPPARPTVTAPAETGHDEGAEPEEASPRPSRPPATEGAPIRRAEPPSFGRRSSRGRRG